jgi:hypothetical protein
MRKTKVPKFFICVYFSFFLYCFLFISQCFFVHFTPNLRKRREKCRERVSNLCFSMKNYTTVLFFSFFIFARIFILHYISIVILYFFYLYFRCLCFFILFWSLICIFFFFCFLIFSSFTFHFISINSGKRQAKEFLFIVSQ